MRGTVRAVVVVALVGLSAAFAAASDALRAAPRAPGGLGSLLGGLSVVASQALWIRAETALAERRDADALAYLDLLTELTPQLVAASDHVADEIGANRAREFGEPAAKWSFVREGLRIHDRCVGHNPGVSEAFLNRGIYELRLATDPQMRGRFEDERGEGVLAAAAKDLARARALDPGARDVLEPLGNALRLLGLKRFFGDGDAAGAREALEDAAEVYEELLPLLEGMESDLAGDPAALDLLRRRRRLPAFCRGLAAVAAAPETEREARYAAFLAEFREDFPDLPPLRR